MAAASRVANTYELLENILLYLPLRQLLFAQKVNKKFHAVIQDSLKINQALFWKPSSTEYVEWQQGPPGRTIQDYPEGALGGGCWQQSNSEEHPLILRNPFTHVLCQYPNTSSSITPGLWEPGVFRLSCEIFRGYNLYYCLPCMEERDCQVCLGSLRHPLNTSLSRMLVSDPPPHIAIVQHDSSFGEGDDFDNDYDDDGIEDERARHYFDISSLNGLRFRELRTLLANEDDEAEDEKFRMLGTEIWRNTSKDVDNPTRWEILHILQMNRQQVKALLADEYLRRFKPTAAESKAEHSRI